MKKCLIFTLLISLMIFSFSPVVYAYENTSFRQVEGTDSTGGVDKLDHDDSAYQDCYGLLGEEGLTIVSWGFRIIAILAPTFVIIFGALDFAKAAMAQDEKDMAKSGKNFIIRIVLSIIVFFVPMIVSFLVDNIIDNGHKCESSIYVNDYGEFDINK